MRLLAIAVALSLLGSLGGLLLASPVLLVGDRARARLLPWLISYAVGALLGVSLLELLPEALRDLRAQAALGSLLVGILAFFTLEKFVLWRHCHDTDDCAVHGSAASLVMLGGALHNFVDGAIIGAAVLSSVTLGVSTAIAVAAHQIPQEVGDFAILLGSGYAKGRALALNLLSGLTGTGGAIIMYFAVDRLPGALPYVLPFAAGGFLYVAMADLIPGLHQRSVHESGARQVLLVCAGIATMLVL